MSVDRQTDRQFTSLGGGKIPSGSCSQKRTLNTGKLKH